MTLAGEEERNQGLVHEIRLQISLSLNYNGGGVAERSRSLVQTLRNHRGSICFLHILHINDESGQWASGKRRRWGSTGGYPLSLTMNNNLYLWVIKGDKRCSRGPASLSLNKSTCAVYTGSGMVSSHTVQGNIMTIDFE